MMKFLQRLFKVSHKPEDNWGSTQIAVISKTDKAESRPRPKNFDEPGRDLTEKLDRASMNAREFAERLDKISKSNR